MCTMLLARNSLNRTQPRTLEFDWNALFGHKKALPLPERICRAYAAPSSPDNTWSWPDSFLPPQLRGQTRPNEEKRLERQALLLEPSFWCEESLLQQHLQEQQQAFRPEQQHEHFWQPRQAKARTRTSKRCPWRKTIHIWNKTAFWKKRKNKKKDPLQVNILKTSSSTRQINKNSSLFLCLFFFVAYETVPVRAN